MRPLFERLFTIAATAAAIALLSSVLTAEKAVPVIFRDRPPLMTVDAKEIARELLTERHYKCFNALLTKESHWNPKAKNPTSTASGVGQLLEGTYKNLGMKHSKAQVAQTVAALAYIGRRYGSAGPCGAWRHWKKNNWY